MYTTSRGIKSSTTVDVSYLMSVIPKPNMCIIVITERGVKSSVRNVPHNTTCKDRSHIKRVPWLKEISAIVHIDKSCSIAKMTIVVVVNI